MIVYHVAVTPAADYVARREPHRRAHIERLSGLRTAGAVVAGGPAPDGRSADILYRAPDADALRRLVEEDPYWRGEAWTGWTPRAFTGFVEPWTLPPIVLDGSRRATIVEGRAVDPDLAQLALVELRGAGRIVTGGTFAGGDTFAVAGTEDADAALAAFRERGAWLADGLRTRPYLYVL